MSHNAQLELRKRGCPPHLKRQVHELLYLLTSLGLSEEQQVAFWDAFPGNEVSGRAFWQEYLGYWHDGKSERPALIVFLQSRWNSVCVPEVSAQKEPSRSSFEWLLWFQRLLPGDGNLPPRATSR